MENRTYYEQQNLKNMLRIRDLTADMPNWFLDFMRACETTHASLTRLNYCFDTRVFLNYLISEHKDFAGYAMQSISAEQLDRLTLRDLEIYVQYLGYYIKPDESEYENNEHGKARKIASLRSLFKYLYKQGLISSNPAELLDMPKIHEKAIIRLSREEIASMIEIIESGEGLSERQKRYHAHTVLRDIAIVILFLTTGIRISELVGLNIEDINFKDLSFRVTRKGGDQSILYFDYETEEALSEYLEQRKMQGSYSLSAPLFLSLKKNRITARAVENMIEKYARLAAPLKHITPHKLRSTYGTMLYQQTGDIYLVADVLGHKDVNTTRKHYAAMAEEHRKEAAKAIRLRDEDR